MAFLVLLHQAVGPAGILAAFDNGLYTDTSWVCTTLSVAPASGAVPDWTEADYDDSSWPVAKVISHNRTCYLMFEVLFACT